MRGEGRIGELCAAIAEDHFTSPAGVREAGTPGTRLPTTFGCEPFEFAATKSTASFREPYDNLNTTPQVQYLCFSPFTHR